MSEQLSDSKISDEDFSNLSSSELERAKKTATEAQESLAKLPIMGPALWLYAKDDRRKHTFLADIDWLVVPPVILDQCQLYTQKGIPAAFITWAKVNDTIDARFRSGNGLIAPHEWHSGSHIWLVDIITPFGLPEPFIDELLNGILKGHEVNALVPSAQQGFSIKKWTAR